MTERNTKIKIVIRYEWRILTEDGLLREPAPCGPHYSQEKLNGYEGFETEAAALAALEDWVQRYMFYTTDDHVLIKLHHKIHFL